jgi:hypothetical protein
MEKAGTVALPEYTIQEDDVQNAEIIKPPSNGNPGEEPPSSPFKRGKA